MALSPMKTILGLGKDLKFELTQVQGNAKAAIDAIVSALNGGTGLIPYWSGYHDPSYQWDSTSASYVDPTNAGVGSFIQRTNSNFGTVATAGSNQPGITFTPASSSAAYWVQVNVSLWNGSTNNTIGAQLTDGITVIGITGSVQGGAGDAVISQQPITGIYLPGSASPKTIKIQTAVSGGTGFLTPAAGFTNTLEWTLMRIA